MNGEAETRRLRDALNAIDALDPEKSNIMGISESAAKGIVLLMGETARNALAYSYNNDANENCSSCRFWIGDKEKLRDCRRFPPTLLPYGVHPGVFVHRIPQTSHDHYCGEYKSIIKSENHNASTG